MQHLSEQPCPQYLEAQTECTCTGSDKAQVSYLTPGLHPHPSPGATASAQGRQARSPRLRRRRGASFTAPLPPSRGRGLVGALAVRGRVCRRLPQTQGECAYPGKDTRPGSDTVTRTHTNHGWEPKAHGNGPEDATQGIEGI